MTKCRFTALLVLFGLVPIIAAVPASASTSRPSGVVGHVYINDNSVGVNAVAGFNRHADGSLTAIAGSPFAVGGSGAGRPNASQGSLQLSADGRYLLAVDAGSNEISVLRILPSGSLRIADVVSSNGRNPVSIAVDAGLGDVLFSGDGTKLVGTRVGTSLIDSFSVGADGLLTAAPGSPFAHQTGVFGQFGSEFRPTNQHNSSSRTRTTNRTAPRRAASPPTPMRPTGHSRR
jgi:hypothetical protein